MGIDNQSEFNVGLLNVVICDFFVVEWMLKDKAQVEVATVEPDVRARLGRYPS